MARRLIFPKTRYTPTICPFPLVKDLPLKKLILLLAAFGLVVAACGGSNVSAATVNGTEITVGEVESLINVEDSTIPKDQFAQFLGFLIQWEIIAQAAEEEFGITVSEDEISAEADNIFAQAATPGETREDFVATRGVTEEFLLRVAEQGVINNALREIFIADVPEPTEDQVEAEFQIAALNFANVCASHILVETEEEAKTVLARLADGEDFAALAQELSIDTGSGANGGDLGCAAPSRYVEEFAQALMIAPVGEVYETPVQSQFGYHIILVSERTDPDPEEMPTVEEIVAFLKDQAVGEQINAWFLDKVAQAEVTVDESFGTWQPLPQPQVIPPAP